MATHKDFADWYRAASVTPSPELLDARWKGVEQAAAALTRSSLTSLLRLYCTRPEAGFKAPEFLDTAFRNQDATFPNRDNIEELRVLAGAILRQSVESNSSASTAAALGIVSSSFGSRRDTLTTLDHLRAAERFLATRGEATRDIKTSPQVNLAPMTKERYEQLMPAAVFAPNQTPSARDPLFNTFAEQTTKLNQSFAELSSALWRIIQAQREELNILWWLQAKVSRDLEVPFSKLPRQQASIIFPMELADLTVFLPGPAAIFGVVVAALMDTKSKSDGLTVAEGVNSLPRNWREQRVANLQLNTDRATLCPVLFAMAKSLDTDGEAEWLPIYRKQCDVKIEQPVSHPDLAVQVYNESLFLRALSEIEA